MAATPITVPMRWPVQAAGATDISDLALARSMAPRSRVLVFAQPFSTLAGDGPRPSTVQLHTFPHDSACWSNNRAAPCHLHQATGGTCDELQFRGNENAWLLAL